MPWALWGQVVTAVLTEIFGDKTSFAPFLEEFFLPGINFVVSLEGHTLTCFPSLETGKSYFSEVQAVIWDLWSLFLLFPTVGYRVRAPQKCLWWAQSLDPSVELGKDTLGAAATGLRTHFWHPALNPVASCLSCVHFPLECTQKLGKQNSSPWS